MTYRSAGFVVTVASGLIVLLGTGCEAILGLDWAPSERADGTASVDAAGGRDAEGVDVTGSAGGAGGEAASDGGGTAESECLLSSCPTPASACEVAACVGVGCAIIAAPAGTACADGGGVVCDGAGACVACNGAADCEGSGAACVDHHCESCADGVMNGAETDADCGGGVCPKCGAGHSCGSSGDCKGKLECIQGSCVEEEK